MTRALVVLGVLVVGCEGTLRPGDELASPSSPDWSVDSPGGATPTPALPSAAVCGQAPSGRGYRGFAGEALEAGREDQAAWVEAHRPYPARQENNSSDWMVVVELNRALGTTATGDVEARDPGVGAAFGVVPDSWFHEGEVGAFAVYVTFRYAFKACTRAFGTTTPSLRTGWFEHTAFAPDRPRAEAFCERTQRAAWLRVPTAAEREACVALALELDEPDLTARWALVCASVFASPNFLAD